MARYKNNIIDIKMEVIYKWEFGDEEILGSSIIISKMLEENLYQLDFTQHGTGNYWRDIEVKNHQVITKNVKDSNDEYLCIRHMTLIIKAKCNSPPEELFTLSNMNVII